MITGAIGRIECDGERVFHLGLYEADLNLNCDGEPIVWFRIAFQ